MTKDIAVIVAAAGALALQQPVSDLALQAFVEGTGRPVVMLGGGVHGAAGFAPHASALAPDFTVVRLQTLNISRARAREPLPAGYALKIESAAMARALDRLSLHGPVDLVGVSFGALVALDFALDHPERVRTIALFEPPAFWAMSEEDIARDPAMRAMIELTRTFGPAIEPTDEQLAAFQCNLGNCGTTPPAAGTEARAAWDARRASLRGLAVVPTHRDSVERLRRFGRPVLLMTGAETVDFHRRINDTLATLFPDVERVDVPGGHTAPTASRDAFLTAWRAFLAKH